MPQPASIAEVVSEGRFVSQYHHRNSPRRRRHDRNPPAKSYRSPNHFFFESQARMCDLMEYLLTRSLRKDALRKHADRKMGGQKDARTSGKGDSSSNLKASFRMVALP